MVVVDTCASCGGITSEGEHPADAAGAQNDGGHIGPVLPAGFTSRAGRKTWTGGNAATFLAIARVRIAPERMDEKGRIVSDRITMPTTGSFGPRGRAGVAGPVEAALVGAEVQKGENSPLSVPSIARSFDLGMACRVQ